MLAIGNFDRGRLKPPPPKVFMMRPLYSAHCSALHMAGRQWMVLAFTVVQLPQQDVYTSCHRYVYGMCIICIGVCVCVCMCV